MGEMLKLRWTKAVDINMRIFFANVPEQFEVPVERQRRVVSALHQDLNTTRGGKFVQFLIELLASEHIVIFILLGAIERTKLAVNVADVRVIDVTIDDVSDDLTATRTVTRSFRQIAPGIGERTQRLERPSIQLERLRGRNAFAGEHFLTQL